MRQNYFNHNRLNVMIAFELSGECKKGGKWKELLVIEIC